ncbi:hypothetical protein A2U01_0068655, partial [Trifolium medium]|nr:hypothetical protein [Trifolium medium]
MGFCKIWPGEAHRRAPRLSCPGQGKYLGLLRAAPGSAALRAPTVHRTTFVDF